MQLVDGWSELAAFALIPGVTTTDAEIADLHAEFERVYPDYIADEAWDDIVTRYLFQFVTDRSVLDRIRADMRPPRVELEHVFDRIHEFLIARTRTPKRTLDAREALQLAQGHLEQVVEMRGARDDAGLSEVLPRLAEVPIVIRQSSVGCAPGRQFHYWLDAKEPDLAELFSDEDRELLKFRDDFLDFEALRSGFDSDLNLSQIFNAAEAMTWDDMLLTLHMLRPCFPGPIDASSYYQLWEAGASLWVTAENIEVRTFTATRATDAQYQG